MQNIKERQGLLYWQMYIFEVHISKELHRVKEEEEYNAEEEKRSFMKKGLNFAKRTAKKGYNNKSIRNIAKAIISQAPTALEGLSNKVSNKTLNKILDNDITKTGVDLAAGYALDKLQ